MQIEKGKLGSIKFQLNPASISYEGGREWFNITSAGMKPIPVSGAYKARTASFELLFSKRAFIDVDVEQVFSTLLQYRNSVLPVLFVFGESFAEEVYVIECPINIEAFNHKLGVHEIKIPIKVQIKEAG